MGGDGGQDEKEGELEGMWAARRHRLRNGRRGRSKGHVVPSMDWPRQTDFVGGFTAVDQAQE